jgi:hypothetical protein
MTAAAPSGVVTFLFTDVEGSTRRWEKYADAMRAALAAHDEVLRRVIDTSDVDSADGEEPEPIAAAGHPAGRVPRDGGAPGPGGVGR